MSDVGPVVSPEFAESSERDELFADALEQAQNHLENGYTSLYEMFSVAISATASVLRAVNPTAVTNDVMVDVFDSIDMFVGAEADFCAYLYHLTQFHVADEARRRRRAGVDQPHRSTDGDEFLARAIEGLLPPQAEAVILRTFFGLNGPEAAQAMGRSLDSVRDLLGRAEPRLTATVISTIKLGLDNDL